MTIDPNVRAEVALRRHLSWDQWLLWGREGYLEVRGGTTGARYWIMRRCSWVHTRSADVVNLETQMGLCLIVSGELNGVTGSCEVPLLDDVLAKKLLIEADERLFQYRALPICKYDLLNKRPFV